MKSRKIRKRDKTPTEQIAAKLMDADRALGITHTHRSDGYTHANHVKINH